MTQIKTNQELVVKNVLSFRGKVNNMELQRIVGDMDETVKELGAVTVGNPITATFGVEEDMLDVEVFLPIDRAVENTKNYFFKEMLKIVNAVVISYKGNPIGLQDACNELNQYIMKNWMQPITVGYNLTKHVDPQNPDNTEIDVYVGISPNVL